MLPYYNQPYKLLGPWTTARFWPVYRHHAEIADVVGLDVPMDGSVTERTHDHVHCDAYGWQTQGTRVNMEEIAANLRNGLGQYVSSF